MSWMILLLVILLPIGFALGVSIGRRTSWPRLPLRGQQLLRQGFLERHKLLVDPYVLLVVTLAAAVASGLFAGLTWNVNRSQEELLRRQTELQAQQALPVFRFDRQLVDGDDGAIWTEWLTVTNEGGMARNVDIDTYPVMSITWMDTEDTVYSVDSIPVHQYVIGNAAPEHFDGGIVRFGVEGNASTFGTLESQIDARLKEVDDAKQVWITKGWYVRIIYQDFQGNEREEYYVYGINSDFEAEPERAYPISSSAGQDIVAAWERKSPVEYTAVTLNWVSDDQWLSAFVERLATTPSVDQRTSRATPTST